MTHDQMDVLTQTDPDPAIPKGCVTKHQKTMNFDIENDKIENIVERRENPKTMKIIKNHHKS
jgi:hypothetical protein